MNKKRIKINNIVISETSRPFIVAEAGVNYYDIAKKEGIGAMEAAKLMVKEAAEAGADAIKFQVYKAGKLAIKKSPAYWDTTKESTKSQYELFKKYDRFGEAEFGELAKCAKKNNIVFMSSPFDEEAVELVNKLAPVFKIASADITNFPLLKSIAQKNKPIFLSTGASTIEEIKEAIEVIKKEGNDKIVLLHCVLNYPTEYKNANLGTISRLQEIFPDYLVGYSDHTLPDESMLVLTTAFLLGAKVIEKHFTLDKSLPGNDHYHAMDPEDLRLFVKNIKFLGGILGKKEQPLESELDSVKYARRSIISKSDIPEGTEISSDMLDFKRPGTGISPKFLGDVVGKKTKRKIEGDEVINWEDLK